MKWNYAERISCIPSDDRISHVLSEILAVRGILPDSQATYLFSTNNYLNDPFLFRDMHLAVERINRAISSSEKIVICGDYDVDGITGTSLLIDFFSRRGVQAAYYIPDRMKEGYGLSEHGVRKAASFGASLIITVDNGSTSKMEVELASSLGMDTIITDHHTPSEYPPLPLAFLNPNITGCRYPFKLLAGVGVAFKLVQGYVRTFETASTALTTELISYLDLVALGTVCDVVPLLEENRFFVQKGIEVLSRRSRPGINALCRAIGVKDESIKASTIGFVIGPRINAAGRVKKADLAISLLTGTDPAVLSKLASELDRANSERQVIEQEILEDAEKRIKKLYNKIDNDIITGIVIDGDWHPGVIGIVASRIMEKYFRPTVLIALQDGIGRGSARSIPSYHILEGIMQAQDLLAGCGGHKFAAGFTIKKEMIPAFRESFEAHVRSMLCADDLVPAIKIDRLVCESELSMELAQQIMLMEPFGAGNPAPVLAVEGMAVSGEKVVGDKHLALIMRGSHTKIDAIGFNKSELIKKLDGNKFALCGNLKVDSFRGKKKLKFYFKDIAPA